MSRILLHLTTHVLPVPVTIAMFFVWQRWSGSVAFAALLILLPLLYGYIVPGIATNLLGRWRFTGPGRIGNFYAHHGFLYASKMSPLLLVSFLGTPLAPLSWAVITRVVLCAGALHSLVYWLNDIALVRQGILIINSPAARAGRSPEAIVTRYAPLCFFVIGASYAGVALLAFDRFIVERHPDAATFASVALAGLAIMVVLSTLAYRISERRPVDQRQG